MPRIIVIVIFSILIIGVVTGGGFLLWQRFSGQIGIPGFNGKTPGSLFGNLPSAEQSNSSPQAGTVSANDNDNDGLSNNDELIWKTDPNKADTDGDGYLDGEEVKANHDPTIPAPNDLLKPAAPASQANAVALSSLTLARVEQYFADNLDLSGGKTNQTEQYNNAYAVTDRTIDTMNSYAGQQSIIVQLPRPDSDLITAGAENTPENIRKYLAVANNQSILADSALYSLAQQELHANNNPNTILGMAAGTEQYREALTKTTVPQAAVPVHALLLGYTESLAATLHQIALWDEDPIKSLTATRQLEKIDRQYYPIIYQEMQRLQALQ